MTTPPGWLLEWANVCAAAVLYIALAIPTEVIKGYRKQVSDALVRHGSVRQAISHEAGSVLSSLWARVRCWRRPARLRERQLQREYRKTLWTYCPVAADEDSL